MERCAIARAIVNAPPVLLADEPTGNLDTRTTDTVMGLFKSLNADGMTIVMVTHSPRCAAHVDRVLTMADGRLISAEASGAALGNAAFAQAGASAAAKLPAGAPTAV